MQGDIGMTAQGAGRTAGGIEQQGVQLLWALPAASVRRDAKRAQFRAHQILLDQSQPCRLKLDCDDLGPRRRQLQGLASRGGAKIGNDFPGLRPQQLGWQCGRTILYPPGAFRKTGQLSHVTGSGWQAQASARQQTAIQLSCPLLSLVDLPQTEIERRIGTLSLSHCPGGGLSIALDEALPQPGREGQPVGIESCQFRLALSCDPAQHRIRQTGKSTEAELLDEGDAGGHRCVGRCYQDKQLGHAQAQDVLHAFALAAQWLVHEGGKQPVNLAEPPHRGGCQQSGEGAISATELAQFRMAGEGLVQRLARLQYGLKHIDAQAPRVASGHLDQLYREWWLLWCLL